MNGPIGKQMVDTLVESSANVEVSIDIYLHSRILFLKKTVLYTNCKLSHMSFLSSPVGNLVSIISQPILKSVIVRDWTHNDLF